MDVTHRPRTLSSGFTLVELSVVLVIIGLIVGAVLVGRDMIRAAERRAVITEYEKIQTAIAVFRDKYNCIPGDCSTATNFFGTDSNGCPFGGGATGTCNGDGDGIIEFCPNGGVADARESYRLWQQLAQANLWAGSFTGVFGSGGNMDSDINSNVPGSRYPGVGWTNYNCTNPWGNYPTLNLRYENDLILGAEAAPGVAGSTWTPAIPPIDAQAIDTKMDDGLSMVGGRMFCGYVGAGLCVASTVTGTYNNTISSPICSCIFRLKL